MALKTWSEMRKIDVTPYCEERDGMTYLNWAKCIDLLHENGAEKVFWTPIPDEKTGSSLRMVEKVFSDNKNSKRTCYKWFKSSQRQFNEPTESVEQHVQIFCEMRGHTDRSWV